VARHPERLLRRLPRRGTVQRVTAALPLLLWFGRDHGFYLDEFQILGADGLSNTGYLDGHNGHWITLLRVEYRLNFELWGLRSYLPYRLPAIDGHLVSVVLLRQVCRPIEVRGLDRHRLCARVPVLGHWAGERHPRLPGLSDRVADLRGLACSCSATARKP
jgi:hypothetical protein